MQKNTHLRAKLHARRFLFVLLYENKCAIMILKRHRCDDAVMKGKSMKIIGSDYDGTFTCGGVTDEKLQAIAKWQAAGNKFGIISGRGGSFFAELKEQYPTLTLDFFAGCNGGYIMDGEGAVIYAAKFRSVSLVELVEDVFAFGCGWVHIHADSSVTVKADNPDFREAIPNWEGGFSQAAIWLPDENKTKELANILSEKYGEFLTPLINGGCLDIVPKGVNKADGLLRVARYFNCSRDNVIAVGDNINDIDMLVAFPSYAMASGKEEVQRLAGGVVADITEIFEKE